MIHTIKEREEKISNLHALYENYPVIVASTRNYIDYPNTDYPIWLTIMGLQETANALNGISAYDMKWHPKNHEED